MAEIGATLQSARTGAGLDIADLEAETKIRAKYLRALEQEDWDQLPGPTYVRSFLRTYADALGLDGRMLVEQYRLRHENLTDQDLQPISPVRRRAPRERRPGPPRGAVIAALVLLLIASLWWLGSRGADEPAPAGTQTAATTPASRTTTTKREPKARAKPATVGLQLRATGTVFVCVQDARGRIVVDGRTLDAGQRTRTLRSRAFRIRLGNGEVRMFVNGEERRLSDRSPQAYRVSGSGVRAIGLDRSPSCAAG